MDHFYCLEGALSLGAAAAAASVSATAVPLLLLIESVNKPDAVPLSTTIPWFKWPTTVPESTIGTIPDESFAQQYWRILPAKENHGRIRRRGRTIWYPQLPEGHQPIFSWYMWSARNITIILFYPIMLMATRNGRVDRYEEGGREPPNTNLRTNPSTYPFC